MKSLALATFLACILFPLAALADDAPTAAAPMKCERGPLQKTYGNSSWLVYGCSDDHSLVIVTAQDNPAGPFYFRFSPQNDGYHLTGEGTGARDAVRAAVEDLKKLSKQDIADLLAAANKTVSTAPSSAGHTE